MSGETAAGAVLARGGRVLAAAGLARARREAAVLLAAALGSSRESLWAHPEQTVEPDQAARFLAWCRRRAAGEPSAYITGRREFWSMELAVDPRVLIPRPETEHLVEAVLELMPGDARWAVDFGTGSGCIALALARERPGLRLLAVDASGGALQVAAANARRHGLQDRVRLLQARSTDTLAGSGWLDVLVSNPPYIPGSALAGLAPEVRDHEPVAALSPGRDGLELSRRLVAAGGRLLRPGGMLALEVDAAAAGRTLDLVAGAGWAQAALRPDLAGLSRVLVATRAERRP